MKLLFDQVAPAPLRRQLPRHSEDTLPEKGWSGKGNGELLDLAGPGGYGVLVKTGQNLARRRVGVIVLLSTDWFRIRLRAEQIARPSWAMPVGRAVEVPIPWTV